ncbi:hypothetical protein Ciccas_005236 [Cichlidogyrus casuarinus]|uniref:cGMP-dependent protein kinase n=1 Tax=Cichlidogyrus casuarinus TaxID=1844966 RepID=A0ABD2QA55_9PLAT
MPFGLKGWSTNSQIRASDPSSSSINQEHRTQIEQNLRAEIANLKIQLLKKDEFISRLSQENDKLKSVLNQQTVHLDPEHSHDQAADGHGDEVSYSVSLNRCSNSVERSDNAKPLEGQSPHPSEDVLKPLPQIASSITLQKRQGVSAEPSIQPTVTTAKLKYYEKDTNSRNVIRQALRENDLLKNMDALQLQEMVSCMQEREVPEGNFLIREGDDGRELYVGAEGEYEVWKNGEYLSMMGAGRCFGELALLYNCKRTASVKAVHKAKVWSLDRSVFQTIMMKTGIQMMEERQKFLKSVPLLKNVSKTQFMRIADMLEAQFHAAGDYIIRKDELADSFFIIQSGEVVVTMPKDGQEVEIRRLGRGEYFGEKALLSEGRRTASIYATPPGVDVLCLYRKDFLELIGNIQELKEKDYSDEQSLVRQNSSTVALKNKADTTPPTPLPTMQHDWGPPHSDHQGITTQLKPKKTHETVFNPDEYNIIAILGVGGFGRVELVHAKGDTSRSFAIKRMRKSHIVKTRQQDHVLSEKRILLSIDHPFICKLYATARDQRFVYLLLEVCLGGELWTLLRDLSHLTDKHVRFSLACVIEAFDYLHGHGIVYRDLKPENLVIANRGYLKLCDFGFAKYIGVGSKTWTFCGTPEYVAPEVILNKGHDFAADYWSLGILTCELLTGTPPFQASEPIRIYMKTLKGIDSLDLGHHNCISTKAYHFIKKLCRNNPAERIGVGRNGLQEIRSHKYFQGFDWEGIAKQTMTSPLKYKVNSALDVSNFDNFPMTDIRASIEDSGWDVTF